MKITEFYMKKAIKLAKKAGELGEVPIGAVIVKDGKVLSSAYNNQLCSSWRCNRQPQL